MKRYELRFGEPGYFSGSKFRLLGPPHPVDGGDYASLADISDKSLCKLLAAAAELEEDGMMALGAYAALESIIEDHPEVGLLLPGLSACKKLMEAALQKSGVLPI